MASPVRLHNKAAFKAALADYHMSEHAQKVLKDSKLVVLSGIAGGGRNSTINYLVEKHGYFFMVSDTTRPPKLRDGFMEINGVNYHFRSEEDMLRDIQDGEFVEAEVIHNQQVSGTSIRELARANNTGRITVHEAEFGGVQFIANAKPDAHIIGLLPPSYDEWLNRLRGREVMHEDELLNRLRTAEKVLLNMLGEPYFKFVVNETIAECADTIRQIVEFGNVSEADQMHARTVAEDILRQVSARLE